MSCEDYTPIRLDGLDTKDCLICLELVDLDRIICQFCDRCFCSSCIDVWLKSNSSCPQCRKDIFDPKIEVYENADEVWIDFINNLLASFEENGFEYVPTPIPSPEERFLMEHFNISLSQARNPQNHISWDPAEIRAYQSN